MEETWGELPEFLLSFCKGNRHELLWFKADCVVMLAVFLEWESAL